MVVRAAEYGLCTDLIRNDSVCSPPITFPVRLNDAVMKIKTGWPADIHRGRNIGDFRKWKQHNDCQKAFQRLLRDLTADDRGKK